MKNKKSLIAIIAILLVAVVGVTFAYFQSTGTFENVFQAGIYKLTTTEVFESPDNWAPGQTIPKTITTTNEGTIPAAVRVSYTEQWLDGDTDITSSVEEDSAIINFDNRSDWKLEDGYYYYKYILNPGDTTSSFIKSVTLNDDLDDINCVMENQTQVCESTSPALGALYKLTITKETVQANAYHNVWNTNVDIIENTDTKVTILSGTKGNLQPGDMVGIGETEDFYVLSSDNSENGKTILLAKYNLLVGSIYDSWGDDGTREIQPNDSGYCLQNEEAQAYNGNKYNIGIIAFSNSPYWMDGNNLKDEYKNGENIYYDDSPSEEWNRRFKNVSTDEEVYPYVYDENSILYQYISGQDGYVNRLIDMGAPSTITGRLPSYNDVINLDVVQNHHYGENSYIYNGTNFWLGNVMNKNAVYGLSTMYDGFSMDSYDVPFYSGLRPVIEIPTSEIN